MKLVVPQRFGSLAAFSLLLMQGAVAQTPDAPPTERVFRLGEVSVRGRRTSDSASTASSRTIEAFNRLDVGRALNLLPGVTLSSVGGRNETMTYVRGFDLRQVPVFIDGIPVYVPFDGYVDLGRFTTFDLAQISVEKGFASVTYGPNTLGGAINLVSRRPQQRLEFDGRAGLFSGNGHRLNLNLGSRFGKFYVQGSASQLKQTTYPLSKDFVPVAQEDGGDRENAWRNDRKYSLKLGFVPNATDEYAISYVSQLGAKGTPPYVGGDTRQPTRFWQWPYWNKESLYFISRTALTASTYLKARLFYDHFANQLSAYDNNTYTTQARGSSFTSYYNDNTQGGSLEWGYNAERHSLKTSAHYKHDDHRENNAGEPIRTFIDQTFSLGLEDTYRLNRRFSLVPGISYNARQSVQAENYNSSTRQSTPFARNQNGAFNAQVGFLFQPDATQQLSLTLARKTRFPTIKDRYSYRLGAAIPNPGLRPENALHAEVAFTGTLGRVNSAANRATLQTSLFYSRLTDAIQQVNNVQPNIYQFQNTGEATFMGGDVSLRGPLGPAVQSGIQYSYIERRNLTNPDLRFIDVPSHKVIGHMQAQVWRVATLTGSVEYNSARYSTSYGTQTGGFMVTYLKGTVQLHRYVSVEGGVNNLFDRNYALAEGFPEPGRSFFVNLVLSNL